MNKYIDDEISIIKNKYNYGNNLNQILNIYNDMINDKKDEIEIIYKPKNKGKIKIFGSQFVYYNKDKCKIIYNNKEYELTEYFDNIDNELKIKLKGITKITKIKSMFNSCYSLFSLPDIYKWNTSNVTDMNFMFNCCKSLTSLPDISKWNTSNDTEMFNMFWGCKSSLNIPSKFKK